MARSSTSGQGRPKGVPNKVTKTVRETFERVFTQLQQSDTASLEVWAEGNPTEFYRLCSKLIPAQVEAKVDAHVTIATGVPEGAGPALDLV